MILHIYTIIHVLISLAAIFTGIVVLFGMIADKRLDSWTKWFLITAVATTVTGFLFPVSRTYASRWSRHHFDSVPRDHDFRSLFETSRRGVALDLRDRRRDLSLFQFVCIGRA